MNVRHLQLSGLLVFHLVSCSRDVDPPVKAPAQAERQVLSQPSPARLGACSKITAQELRSEEPGMMLMGDTGSISFYGHKRALLCSEPGPGGIGECEIVADKVIKVVTPSETLGLKPQIGRVPSRLVYGPDGVFCEPIRN
ncbi:hypothetical protein ACFQZQ_09695 [Lysobacter koreensis]|uniref:Lipoprotein n=1 Tax=Lysobacter koreensis TaxID=266122 RepID=A0ABW2YMU0_9GAMM